MSESQALPIYIDVPADKGALADFCAGDSVLLSGTIYTMRDAGHMRAVKYLKEHGELPYNLEGAVLFYAGPTPAAAGRPLGSVGPTTASRMDFAAPTLYEAGIAATIGKGKRGAEVANACAKTGAVHFMAVGGVAALLAKCVKSAEVVAWEDLGAEALMKLSIENFPAFVAIDSKGNDIFAITGGKA